MPHRLLLADDSVTIQRVIELTFADEDVQVVAVSDGEQAIARLQADRYDVVLADIGMPKRNGYEVAAFMKERHDLAAIPVLLLAGAFEPVDEARAQQVGSSGVLVKPFEPQQLIARVRELLEGSPATPQPDVPRAVERLASIRQPELPPRREEPRPAAPPAARAPALRVPDDAPPRARPQQNADESLDDYFDRLDAAFANLTPSPTPPPSERPPERLPVRAEAEEDDRSWFRPAATFATPPSVGMDWPLGHAVQSAPIEPPDTRPTMSNPSPPPAQQPQAQPSPTPPAPAAPRAEGGNGRVLAEAFSALLALEQGEPGAGPVRLTVGGSKPTLDEALVDEIVARVAERLGPAAVREVVRDIVSEVAERLVRDEIERIRRTGS